MIRPHHALVGSLAVLALLGGYLMLPDAEERAAMYLRDNNRSAAIAELEALVVGKGGEIRLKRLLAGLYEAEGRVADAIEMLRQVAQATPDDATVWRRLAALYELEGEADRRTASLARAVAHGPDEQTVRRLIDIHRLAGDSRSELAILERFAQTQLLDDGNRERLGSLLHARGRHEAAVRVLAPLDDGHRALADQSRLILFDALVRTGRTKEAAAHAQRWLAAGHLEWHTGEFVLEIVHAAGPEKAFALIEPLIGRNNREVRAVLDQLIDQRYWRIAKTLLARMVEQWFDPSLKDLLRYVDYSRRIGDQAGPIGAFARALDGGMTLDAQARFAEALALVHGPAVLSPFHELFGGAALSRRPVFAAGLALSYGNPMLAQHYLLATDLPALTPTHRQEWIRLAEDLLPVPAIFDRLEALYRTGRLPVDLMDSFQRISARAGQVEHQAMAWQSIRRRKP